MTFKKYIFTNLWLQVVISLIVGLSVGLILGDDVGIGIDDENLDFATSYLKIPASIFVSLIYMIIVPLIFSSIVMLISGIITGFISSDILSNQNILFITLNIYIIFIHQKLPDFLLYV